MIQNVFIEADDPRWSAHLKSSNHDLYHLPAYAQLEAEWIGARAIAFLYQEEAASMMLVLLERSLPGGEGKDAVSPYGYSSPIVSIQTDAAFLRRAFLAYDEAARARGILTTFIRLHPILMPGMNEMIRLPRGNWLQDERGVTLTMPLDGDDDAFLAGMARGHRASVRRLRAGGAQFVIDTAQVWSAFPSIYRHNMEKVGASAAYFYSDEYVEKFRKNLEGVVHCGGIVGAEGHVMCAGLFTQVGGILQYHLSGTADGFARQAPMKLLLAEMRCWALSHRVEWFHLGGGLGGLRDTLWEFKKQFGGAEHAFRSLSIVHDNLKYDALIGEMSAKKNIADLVESKFFPRYRAPDLADDA